MLSAFQVSARGISPRDGSPKLVPAFSYPLTGLACVDRVYTAHAVFDLGPDGAVLRETFDCSAGELAARFAKAPPHSVRDGHRLANVFPMGVP